MRKLKVVAASGLALASLLLWPGSVAGQFGEAEPNGTKGEALLPVYVLSPGAFLTGTSTGTSVAALNSSLTSADTFLVRTTLRPLGIYRHRLTLTTTGTAGHTGTIRGLNQVAGVIGAVDSIVQTSVTSTIPPRSNFWYGFGRQEDIFYRVTGTAATAGVYTATLTTTSVVPTIIGPFAPGVITLQGLLSDSEIIVYDSALDPVAGFMNDDFGGTAVPFALLTRTFTPGTYYAAIGLFNTTNNQPSPADDFFRTGIVLDFPNVVANSVAASAGSLNFRVTDCGGVPTIVPAALAQPFQVLWYQFTVACPAIAISASPVSTDACEGHPAMFQVVASGSGSFSYQWRYNTTPISGANSDTFLIPAVGFAHAGSYDVVVSNCCGSTTSSPATLTVHPDGPDITDQPDQLSLCIGDTASFTVAASAHMGGNLSYQWRKDGMDILGAVFPTYSFTVLGFADGGQYDCVVTEVDCGFSTSTTALLTVRNDPPVITLTGLSDITIECHSGTYTELGATAQDDCDTFVAVSIGGDVVDNGTPGMYIVRYNATDSQGHPAAEVTRTVFVQDTVKPVVQLSVSTSVLWSPNHEMVNVGFVASATDECNPASAAASLTIRVFADEIELPDTGDGTGRHSPDAKDIASGTLRLRSERRGAENGRVYLIVASASDESGNTTFAFATVVCPSAQNQASLDTINAQAAAALATAMSDASSAVDIDGVMTTLTSQGWREDGLAEVNGPHQ